MERNKIAYIIGYNIKIQLNLHEQSVRWLSDKSGVENSQLRKYMSGYLLMGVDKLVRISDALKCSPADLLRGTSKDDIETMYNSVLLEDQD